MEKGLRVYVWEDMSVASFITGGVVDTWGTTLAATFIPYFLQLPPTLKYIYIYISLCSFSFFCAFLKILRALKIPGPDHPQWLSTTFYALYVSANVSSEIKPSCL